MLNAEVADGTDQIAAEYGARDFPRALERVCRPKELRRRQSQLKPGFWAWMPMRLCPRPCERKSRAWSQTSPAHHAAFNFPALHILLRPLDPAWRLVSRPGDAALAERRRALGRASNPMLTCAWKERDWPTAERLAPLQQRKHRPADRQDRALQRMVREALRAKRPHRGRP